MKRTIIICFIGLFMLCVSAPASAETTVRLDVIEDTYVDGSDEGFAGNNYNAYPMMWAGHTLRNDSGSWVVDTDQNAAVLLKFDLAGVDKNGLTSATLWLHNSRPYDYLQPYDSPYDNDTALDDYAIRASAFQRLSNLTVYKDAYEAWSEGNVTFNEFEPYFRGGVKGSTVQIANCTFNQLNPGTADATWGPQSWNITAFVLGELNTTGEDIMSLSIVAQNDADDNYFHTFSSSEAVRKSDGQPDGFGPYIELTYNVVPEPVSAGLFLFGGASLLFMRRKRR